LLGHLQQVGQGGGADGVHQEVVENHQARLGKLV
jgi:hypothetical protein